MPALVVAWQQLQRVVVVLERAVVRRLLRARTVVRCRVLALHDRSRGRRVDGRQLEVARELEPDLIQLLVCVMLVLLDLSPHLGAQGLHPALVFIHTCTAPPHHSRPLSLFS